ncbi:hypothetical protein [Roseibacillus ishigakijimensis]|uniref:Uncharacterized protein n=1 Tax=Roseibacillus ishigakijimensis TaxID=454146 RepID=A0A934VHC3_9BACT|nr:hypothetical protein [Roseibacillus ishigakijimensis]MBK1833793.1 hypothetical protein [Roseibacillus ishigakijimensis]
MITQTGHLTEDLEKDLELVSAELHNELVRAERELELEHAQLKALVGEDNPELVEQMKAMEESITRLYNGLEKAVLYLQLAQGESYILRQQMQSRLPATRLDRLSPVA